MVIRKLKYKLQTKINVKLHKLGRHPNDIEAMKSIINKIGNKFIIGSAKYKRDLFEGKLNSEIDRFYNVRKGTKVTNKSMITSNDIYSAYYKEIIPLHTKPWNRKYDKSIATYYRYRLVYLKAYIRLFYVTLDPKLWNYFKLYRILKKYPASKV